MRRSGGGSKSGGGGGVVTGAAAAISTSSTTRSGAEAGSFLLDEQAQEDVIVDMLHANIKARQWFYNGLCVVFGVLACAALYFALVPDASSHLTQLRRRGVLEADIVMAMCMHCASAGLGAAVLARRATAGSTALLLSPSSVGQAADAAAPWPYVLAAARLAAAGPLLHFGFLYAQLNLWNLYAQLWLPLLPAATHAFFYYCERMLLATDSEVHALIKQQYSLKSA